MFSFCFWKKIRLKPSKRFVDLSGKKFSDEQYNILRKEQEIYALSLLDKIQKHGKDSLCKSEKKFLTQYSQSSFLK